MSFPLALAHRCFKQIRPQGESCRFLAGQLIVSAVQDCVSMCACRGATRSSSPSRPHPLLLPFPAPSHCSSHTQNSTGRPSPLRSRGRLKRQWRPHCSSALRLPDPASAGALNAPRAAAKHSCLPASVSATAQPAAKSYTGN